MINHNFKNVSNEFQCSRLIVQDGAINGKLNIKYRCIYWCSCYTRSLIPTSNAKQIILLLFSDPSLFFLYANPSNGPFFIIYHYIFHYISLHSTALPYMRQRPSVGVLMWRVMRNALTAFNITHIIFHDENEPFCVRSFHMTAQDLIVSCSNLHLSSAIRCTKPSPCVFC